MVVMAFKLQLANGDSRPLSDLFFNLFHALRPLRGGLLEEGDLILFLKLSL